MCTVTFDRTDKILLNLKSYSLSSMVHPYHIETGFCVGCLLVGNQLLRLRERVPELKISTDRRRLASYKTQVFLYTRPL